MRRHTSYGQLKAEESAAKKELDEAQAELVRIKRETRKTSFWAVANGVSAPHSLVLGLPQSLVEWINLYKAHQGVAAARRNLRHAQANLQAKRAARKKKATIRFGIGIAGAGFAAFLGQAGIFRRFW